MNTDVFPKAADAAHDLSESMRSRFGATIAAPKLTLVTDHEAALARLPPAMAIRRTNVHGSFTAIRASQAGAVLRPGMGFGLMTDKGVAPAIISPRSADGELHVLYLDGDEIHPEDIGHAKLQFTDLQIAALQGASPFQDRRVGDDSADGTRAIASESGHGLSGIMALTDIDTRQALVAGHHGVHALAKNETGIMPAYAQPNGTSLGLLSTAERPVTPQEKIITAVDTGSWLIDNPQFRALSQPLELEVTPDVLVVGFALVAAQSQLGQDNKQVRNQLLTIMGTM